MASNDRQWIEALARGDRAALGELLELHQHRLFNVALRMVGNRDDAAEVTQEAMLKIVENIDDFQGKSNISTWMIRIAMNLSISHLRKQRTRQALSLDDSGPDNGQDQSAPLRQQLADPREPAPATSVEQREMIRLLHIAMGRLDADFRSVIVLRDIDQMGYEQMAHVLQIPVGTVKSRLFRARLSLRQEMLRLCPPPLRAGRTPGGLENG